MTPRLKKLFGTFMTVIWLPLYAVIATAIGLRVLPQAGWFVTLLYYALAGTLWILPIGLLLPWMHREPED
ncbi:MAG TPA: DUF2842 domain-containing protein [Rhizomicrobium sp.]|nr:DUF2842 domain-containing protein [Rhizomicrobium sp.]